MPGKQEPAVKYNSIRAPEILLEPMSSPYRTPEGRTISVRLCHTITLGIWSFVPYGFPDDANDSVRTSFLIPAGGGDRPSSVTDNLTTRRLP